MMNVRLILILVILVTIVGSIGAAVIRACTHTCFKDGRAYACCKANEVDIVGTNGFVSQQRNNTYANSLRKKRSAGPTLHTSYYIHKGFTAEEIAVINNAKQVVTNRLFTPRVRDCTYSITGNRGYHLGAGVYARSNLDEDDNYAGHKDLLKFQLDCLEMEGVRQTFPLINIRPWHELSDTVAKATLGCVTVTSKGSNFTTKGQFNVWLNQNHLADPTRTGYDADYWAGVIVHEMLHNLGHRHDDYSDSWQINVFEKCLVKNGNYSPGKRTFSFNYLYYVLYH